MTDAPQWQIQISQPPAPFIQAVQRLAPQLVPETQGTWLAQLLWQRGLRDVEDLPGWLNPHHYQPTSPLAFGGEMEQAIARIQTAIASQEIVAIWGDFDADGVTATAVLWEGLGQFFTPHKTLVYHIPNRLLESHGLSNRGLTQLHKQGCRLVITCDTGSTNAAELAHAQSLGMDVIVTDHHTLPETRPPVVALINPRSLPPDHPLATLSGVAVAYKLVEALYLTLPEVPKRPLEALLDLVAIGLIADLVELRGDCRYLAQRGIAVLQRQANPATTTRPGVAKLLAFCQKTGDRPTDISFGLGPRINAVSRIQGDAHFCVELLTSTDAHLCNHLAEATELANTRRKGVQNDVVKAVRDRLAQVDLSTTPAIVLTDAQWLVGILGLVAGQIAQEYGRPTFLLSTEGWTASDWTAEPAAVPSASHPTGSDRGHPFPIPAGLPPLPLAKGSARSVGSINLYDLVKQQEHLLDRFGGHPLAAGLSLPIANLPLFTEAINQQLRQLGGAALSPVVTADLIVTIRDLNKALFQALKLLEPCGMGNPVPRLLIQNCWFTQVKNHKLKDRTGAKINYIKTEFFLRDDSCPEGFPGEWWGHYQDEIPADRCDAIVELDTNSVHKRYEVRLIAVRPHCPQVESVPAALPTLLDWRTPDRPLPDRPLPDPLVLTTAPTSWTELYHWVQRAHQEQRPLAIAVAPPPRTDPMLVWQQLVGIAKYLSRTGQAATRQQLQEKLHLGDRALDQGLQTLTHLGFHLTWHDQALQCQAPPATPSDSEALSTAIATFLSTVQEETFRRRYFAELPLDTLQSVLWGMPDSPPPDPVLSASAVVTNL